MTDSLDTDEFVILEDDEFVILCDAPLTQTVVAGPPEGPTLVNVWVRCAGNVKGIRGTGAVAGYFTPLGAYATTNPATWKSRATAEAYAERIRNEYSGAKYGTVNVRVRPRRAVAPMLKRQVALLRIREIDRELSKPIDITKYPANMHKYVNGLLAEMEAMRVERVKLAAEVGAA